MPNPKPTPSPRTDFSQRLCGKSVRPVLLSPSRSHKRTPAAFALTDFPLLRHSVTPKRQLAGAVPFRRPGIQMDIQRKNVGRKKAIRWTVAVVIILRRDRWHYLSRCGKLKPAAPEFPVSTLWPGTVRARPDGA